VIESDDREQWHFGERWYAVSGVSEVGARDGFSLELEDIGPAPGRGVLLVAFRDDQTGETTIDSKLIESLPLELVERFLAEARLRLPPKV
jgi:hypothetical protein